MGTHVKQIDDGTPRASNQDEALEMIKEMIKQGQVPVPIILNEDDPTRVDMSVDEVHQSVQFVSNIMSEHAYHEGFIAGVEHAKNLVAENLRSQGFDPRPDGSVVRPDGTVVNPDGTVSGAPQAQATASNVRHAFRGYI